MKDNTHNSRLGLVITDGVGFRNFVLSDFMHWAAKSYSEVIVFSEIPSKTYLDQNIAENVRIVDLPRYTESRKSYAYRKLKELAHMQRHRTSFGIDNNLNKMRPKGFKPRSIFMKGLYAYSRFSHSEKAIQKFEKKQFDSFKGDAVYEEFKTILTNYQPDHLFFTHQRPGHLAPLAGAAKELDITHSTFIFSWDNLASKGRMMSNFDHYFVWSDLMKSEMLHYYSEVKPDQVHVIGTPQFEPYVLERYQSSKDQFIERFDLNPAKKTICYSCADAGIGGNDPIHIEAVVKYINTHDDLQLLVRTSPAEDGSRFSALMDKYESIKWNIPEWPLAREGHVEEWSQRVPTRKDVTDLRSILEYSDINVNMFSTMSLDFMLFDKPVVNVAFGNEENGLYNDQVFMNYIHLQPLINSNAICVANDSEELHRCLKSSLADPDKNSKDRKEIIDLEISVPLEGTSERIVKKLLSI